MMQVRDMVEECVISILALEARGETFSVKRGVNLLENMYLRRYSTTKERRALVELYHAKKKALR